MSGPEEETASTPRDWVRYAEGDLRVAGHEIQTDAPSFHTICFLCHGAAEKFLKAYLISKGWTLRKTHDILELLDWCADYNEDLGSMESQGAILNEYIIAGRYPASLKS